MHTVGHTLVLYFFFMSNLQVLHTVSHTFVLFYFVKAKHMVLYRVCHTLVLLYSLEAQCQGTAHSLLYFWLVVLFYSTVCRYCTQSVVLLACYTLLNLIVKVLHTVGYTLALLYFL